MLLASLRLLLSNYFVRPVRRLRSRTPSGLQWVAVAVAVLCLAQSMGQEAGQQRPRGRKRGGAPEDKIPHAE